MSQQIQITGGAKVRDLQDVIIGTSGVLSSVAFNVANGVPKLDSNGKILVSQLPNSVMEYLGTWNAATNTPTLANGTGNQGDVWLCTTPGTVNFGAGPITFIVGDSAIYSGSIWQRSGGATGSVTSVGLSTNGGAITIGSSPVTTSGVISFNFNGTNLQYVNGAGNLTTFPTLMTSVGLTMPSAFTVTNSPLTGAGGTLAVTGAGTTAQYIRGDGSLATFPTIATEAQRLITEVYNETGATLTKGTVVYVNGGHGNLPTITKAIATGDATSAQTYGIVQTDITNNNNGYVVVIGSLTDLDTSAYVEGTQLYLSSTTAGAWTSTKQYAPAHLVYVAIVTRSHPTQGVVEVRIQNGFEMDELHNVSAQSPANGGILQYVTSTGLWTAVAGTTTNIAEGTNLYFTDAKARLAISLTTTETSGASTYNNTTGVLNIPQYQAAGTYVTSVTGTSPIVSSGGTTPAISIPVATSSANGYLSSTDWLTFNGKIGGGGTTNYIPKFSGTFSIADSIIYDNSGNVLINTTDSSIGHRLAVYSATEAAQVRVMGLAPSVLFTESTTNTNSYSAYLGVATSVNNFVTGTGIGDYVMSNNSNYPLVFATNSSIKMKMFANGNLAVGTTTDSGYKLDVNGTFRAVGAASFSSSVTANGLYANAGNSARFYRSANDYYWSINNDASNYLNFGTYLANGTAYGTNPKVVLFDSGNVGIGTAASDAGYKLDVNGTGRFSNELRIDGAGIKLFVNGSNSLGGFFYQQSITGTTYANNMQMGASGDNQFWNYTTGGGWVKQLSIATTGAATFSSSVSTGDMVTIAISDISTGENKGLRLNNTGGGGKAWNITAGKTGSNNADFVVRNSTTHANVLALDGSSGSAEFISSIYATAFFESSDSRLKTLIQDNYQTKGIASITPKLYTKNGKVELGYYAQDFVGVLDSAVSKDSDDMLSLSYREVLVAKVYALEQEIKDLKAKIN